jgi:tight adherence protein C
MMVRTEYIPVLISLLVFFTILLFFVGASYYFRQRLENRKLIEKIKRGGEKAKPKGQADLVVQPPGPMQKHFLNFFGFLGQRVGPGGSTETSHLRLNFLKAGIRRENAPAIFWGIKSFSAILFPGCFFMVRLMRFKLMSPSVTFIICTMLAIAGFYLPDLWLRIKIARRREKIAEGLPDALDLLVVCVEAGLGLDTAINRVAEEIKLSHKVLSDELKLLTLELRAGKSRRDALKNLALRIDWEDINSLVTLLIQTDKFGTSVAQALRVYSDAFRTKRYQRAEEIAAKIPVKLVFPLILFIFPSLFIAILAPPFIRLWRIMLSQ